jgi:hypothetical protein
MYTMYSVYIYITNLLHTQIYKYLLLILPTRLELRAGPSKLGSMGRAIETLGGAADHRKKTSWPEVVGMAALAAAWRIQEDMPDVHIQFHRLGYHTPPGYNGHRVRIILVADPGPPSP